MAAPGTMFRPAALAWVAVGLATLLYGVSGPHDGDGMLLASSLIGGALSFAVAAAMWHRRGRGSAVAGVLLGLLDLPSLLYIPLLPGWYAIPSALALVALVLSAMCLWQSRGTRDAGDGQSESRAAGVNARTAEASWTTAWGGARLARRGRRRVCRTRRPR